MKFSKKSQSSKLDDSKTAHKEKTKLNNAGVIKKSFKKEKKKNAAVDALKKSVKKMTKSLHTSEISSDRLTKRKNISFVSDNLIEKKKTSDVQSSKKSVTNSSANNEGLISMSKVSKKAKKRQKKLKDHFQTSDVNESATPNSDSTGTPINSSNTLKKKKKKKLSNSLVSSGIKATSASNITGALPAENSEQVKKKKKKKHVSLKVNKPVENSGNAPSSSGNKPSKLKRKRPQIIDKSIPENTVEEFSSANADSSKQVKKRQKLNKEADKAFKPVMERATSVHKGMLVLQSSEHRKSVLSSGEKSSKVKKMGLGKKAESVIVNKPEGKSIRKKKKNKEQKNNNVKEKDVPTNKLKGKALKKKIARLANTVVRLKEHRDRQAALLLKESNSKKIKKIQAVFNTLNDKVAKFENEIETLKNARQAAVKDTVTAVQFIGLPAEQAPPVKKKEKHLPLKDFLQNQLKGSRFRWLNENLYSSSSGTAQEFFKEDPESFKAYHEGYAEQVSKWPVNPLDTIIGNLKSFPKGTVVADLGCGEAKLAASLPHLTVHSLDFVALKPEVVACDMAHCPLLRNSVDIVVFCLSLMGTNVSDFLLEANRILKTGGTMEIAEVESRFDSIEEFVKSLERYGFELKKKALTDMFFFLSFKKKQDVYKSGKLPQFNLKPCLYKKR